MGILDAEGIDRAAFVGWSMGVQVSLDAAATHPQRYAGLVLLNGTYGTLPSFSDTEVRVGKSFTVGGRNGQKPLRPRVIGLRKHVGHEVNERPFVAHRRFAFELDVNDRGAHEEILDDARRQVLGEP